MARKASIPAVFARLLAALMLALACGALAGGLAGCAQEQEPEVVVGIPDEDDPPLLMSLPSMIDVERLAWLELPATCNPDTIEVGIPCGMLEMCGQDPCLCGAVDDYGACACNGKEWVTPTFTVTFEEEGIATTCEAFGKTYLVPLHEGTVNATVHAELPHHQPSEAYVQIHVKGWTFFDVMKVIGAILLVAAVVAGLFFGIRALVRCIKRGLAARRERKAAQLAAGDGANDEKRRRGRKTLRGLDGGSRDAGGPDGKGGSHE